MSTSLQWWNNFWSERLPVSCDAGSDPRSWADLVWQVFLEELNTLFQRLSPGKIILECGCGRATVSRYMAGRGYACTMLDYSEQAIELAKASFASSSLKGEFVLGDMNHLPFPDNQFDAVHSGGVLEFFDDITVPLREIVRVLKPGGLFVVNIIPNKFSCQTLADLERTAAHFLKCLFTLRWKKAFSCIHHLPPGVSRMTLKNYKAAFVAAGLTNVEGYCTTPFPVLSFGKAGERVYVWLIKRLLSQWRWFNHSRSAWSEIWGMAYLVYGTKPEPRH
jgi:ubiquinone/menaquinone biosynthesis C-methylase UbiE